MNESNEYFKPEKFAELDKVINEFGKSSSQVIQVLTRAQDIFGYLPSAIQKRIANDLNMQPSEIRAVVSFYSNFRSQPETPRTPGHICGIEKAWNSVTWMTGENALHSVDEFIKLRRLTS